MWPHFREKAFVKPGKYGNFKKGEGPRNQKAGWILVNSGAPGPTWLERSAAKNVGGPNKRVLLIGGSHKIFFKNTAFFGRKHFLLGC